VKHVTLSNKSFARKHLCFESMRNGIVAFSLFVASLSAVAQENTASLSLQVAICKQIFRYDRTLTKKDTVKVAVVYGSTADIQAVDKLITEFQSSEPMTILCKAVAESDLRDVVFTQDAVYFFKLQQTQLAHDWTTRSAALSLTDSEGVVKSGQATVCVTLASGKPLILINRTSMKREKHEFFGEILSLAKLID